MTTATNYIGQPKNRVDGALKVTGAAKYSAEFNVPDLLYGVVVSGAIAKGRITKIDTEKAESLAGVVKVFTHENRSSMPWFDRSYKDKDSPNGSPFRPLYDENIVFSGQPVALVVAEEFEIARAASALVRVEYEAAAHQTDLNDVREEAYEAPKGKSGYEVPSSRGDAEKAFDDAPEKIDAEYWHPVEHHNPLEMHSSTAVYQSDGKLLVYDKIQGVQNSQSYLTSVFGLSKADVQVLSPFVGGAFGSGLRPQYQLFLAVMAALELKRAVRVSLTRQQMFSFGHRPNAIQNVKLAASPDGKLEAVIHETIAETSAFEDYTEKIVNWSGELYRCADIKLVHKLAQLDLYTPLDMRAPGAATGVFAIECAMDELAHELKIDPLELRLKNYAEKDQTEDKPYSSKELRECYRQAAERFGWQNRRLEPRSMREDNYLIGWGMTTGIWDAEQETSSAKAVLTRDGKLEVSSATADIGTGTYTIMTQIAAETLGFPIDDVTFKLGDSSLPQSPLEGGSKTAATVGSAVKAVCEKVRLALIKLAREIENSPLRDASLEEVSFSNGKIALKTDAAKFVSILDAMKLSETSKIEEETSTSPNTSEQQNYSRKTHSAVFVEARVDENLGTIHVPRVVAAVAAGRILNPKTARSQVLGGIVWGISMALHEESVIDQKYGRFMNHNLSEYHVPVNADIEDIEVIFVEEHDPIVNPLGVKGLGEIGIVGTPAAVANAIFHATGKRVRDLPITLDKLL
jgi:xanthine dehydrogenase YagR molybdenum-binding subunit